MKIAIIITKLIIGAILTTLLTVSSVSSISVLATGIRGDSAEGATEEEHNCWVGGYDSGFAGKYDRDRARECIEHDDSYNFTWAKGCEDSTRTEAECGELINNPVEIEDYEALKGENDFTCYKAGRDDGEAGKPFNKERDDGCYVFNDISGGYEGGYQSGCETHTVESTCELKYEDKRNYCPNHPDVVGCVSYLYNATNKMQEKGYTNETCAWVNITCASEVNPERYCLKYNDTFCKTIGDICDPDGFVKPEYPYCTTN